MKASLASNDSLQLILKRDSVTSRSMESQNLQPSLPNVVLPSPTSYALSKYGINPPSLATGTVNLDIPIYTITAGDYTLPISLKYSTNGIKVYDSPYPVGFGWLLQPAFRITRMVVGKPDEFYLRDSIETTTQLNKLPLRDKYFYELNLHSNNPGAKDAQYDIFAVNLPNESFHFVITKNISDTTWSAITQGTNSKVIVKNQNIEGTFGKSMYFEITDENGLKYIFGEYAKDTSSFEYLRYPARNIDYITAWGLNKIILKGDQGDINFTWSRELNPSIYVRGYQSTETIEDCNYIGCSSSFSSISANMTLGATFNGYSYNYIMQLNKIDFPTGSVNYNYTHYSAIRGSLLKKIWILDKLTNTLLKSAEFSRSGGRESVLLTKLKISGVGEYSFEYNPTRFNHENAQDRWGYYNGKLDNKNLIPKTKILIYDGDIGMVPRPRYVEFGLADRDVNRLLIEAYMLYKVDYPTGGTTEFEYETHSFAGMHDYMIGLHASYQRSFNDGGGLRIRRQENRTLDSSIPDVITYSYSLGHIISPPTIEKFIEENAQRKSLLIYMRTGYYHANRLLYIKSQANYSEYLGFGTHIWYDEVMEDRGGVRTKYLYDYNTAPFFRNQQSYDFNLFLNSYLNTMYQAVPEKLNVASAPILKEKIVFSKINGIYKPVMQEKYQYVTNKIILNNLLTKRPYINSDLKGIHGNGVLQGYFDWAEGDYSISDNLYIDLRSIFGINALASKDYYFISYPYTIELSKQFPSKTIYNELYDKDTITKTISYLYTSRNNNNFLKQKNVDISSGSSFVEQYLYPWEDLSDLSSPQKDQATNMVNANMLATPMQIKKNNNDTFIGHKTIQYKNYGNGLILPEIEYFKSGNGVEEVRISYLEYDIYGNPIYINKDNNTKIVYIWSYKGLYPIAEIKNATYTDVKNALGVSNLNTLSKLTSPDMSAIDDLRTKLPNAYITTFTYKPYVGISTIKDNRGCITYYEYDQDGKLIRILDESKSPIKSFGYNIITQ